MPTLHYGQVKKMYTVILQEDKKMYTVISAERWIQDVITTLFNNKGVTDY